jgi:putative heme-binding domain-containing protein
LSKFTGPQLVNLLRHPNGWVRDTAARLIYERQDPATVIPLIRLLFDPRSPPLARMHALHALDGLQVTAEGRPGRSLLEPHIIRALIDPDDRVREHGVLLAEKFMPINQAVSDRLWEQLVAMTGDPSPQVRYQLAFTLGQTHHEGQAAALTEILRGALNDRWIQAAVFSSLKDGAAEIFVSLLADAKVRGNEPRREILRRLSRMIGAEDRPAEIASALDAIQRIPEAQNAFHFARDLGNSVQSANVSLSELDRAGVLNKLYARAESVAVDMKADDPARVEALELLSTTDTADPALTVGLEEEWPYLRGRVRSQAVTALLSRPWRTTNLLFYLQKGLIPQSDLSPIQVRFLLAYPDRTIRQQAFATFGNSNYSPHQSVLNRYVGALQLSGSAEQGRRIFLMRCAACHQVDSEANSAGLDLRDSLKTNAEALLTEILDPNRNDPPACQATLVETRDGETLMGSIVRRSARSITLRDANGVERVEGRANIVAEAGLGFSMIPEGLEAGLGEQDLANLLAYLTTVTTH